MKKRKTDRKNPKIKILKLRVSQQEFDLVEMAALSENLNKSDFIMRAIQEKLSSLEKGG